ncbi:MAG TPA: M48 family metalloprotease, partial [Candidatus Methylomirabilis sp.]|nr:M48 family metalloprotease [Candidatus Methylomirabilis sp.]
MTIRIMREGLEVAAIGSTRLWPYREIRQTQGFYAGEEVRLERGAEPSEALLVEDVDFLRSLREAAPEIGARFHDPEKRQRRIRFTVLAAVAVVGFAGALYLWGIPGLAAIAAPRVPVKWEERLGRSMVGYLAPADQICHDPGAERVLASIAARLASTVPRSPYAFHVIVVDQPQVNALAAPGGYIVVYRGLIERAR